MKSDKAFWIILLMFLLSGLGIQMAAWEFMAGNTFGNERFADEVIANQLEVPDITRKFAGYVAEQKTEFLELRIDQFVTGSLSALFTLSLIAFVFLSVRQHRLMKRIEKLEAAR